MRKELLLLGLLVILTTLFAVTAALAAYRSDSGKAYCSIGGEAVIRVRAKGFIYAQWTNAAGRLFFDDYPGTGAVRNEYVVTRQRRIDWSVQVSNEGSYVSRQGTYGYCVY